MSASSSMNPVIYSLVETGKTLVSLHDKSKRQAKRENSTLINTEKLNTIHEDVGKVVHQVLKELESHQLPASFPETIIPNVLEKINATLEKFIKLDNDNASYYEVLAKNINDFKPKKQSLAVESSSPPSSVPQHSESTTGREASTSDIPQEDQFASLSEKDKKCIFCFCLFPAGKEVKKREPIHLWVGMGLIDNPSKGDNLLLYLVNQGFVERIIDKKKLCNRYKMNESVHFMVVNAMNISFAPGNSLSIMMRQEHQQPPSPQQPASTNPTALVLNLSQNTLGATTFGQLSKMKNNVKVLHLGIWDYYPKSHKRKIMVEDVENLKALSQLGHVTFLSLQGISEIVELPDSVYKLENLKVLDLRACPNLELLPEGIESLEKLTHLDLSECYLLAQIPKGIKRLTKLSVLKGFVINPEDNPQVGNGNKNRRNASSCASFSDLLNLEELIKLTIRTRRMNFPSTYDFDTLCAMDKLTNLKIAWVWSSDEEPTATASGGFPRSLRKLELQAAPENTVLRLLETLGKDANNSLEKLYIRGGRLRELGMDMHCLRHIHTVRLRYLQDLFVDWAEFREYFPTLTRLEVSKCPNLIGFPCDENGNWEDI